MIIRDGISVWGNPIDEGAWMQIKTASRHAPFAALMADHHRGYSVPIGGVLGYVDAVSPQGVGYDIGCGNKAVRLDVSAHEVCTHISTIMDDIVKRISFGVGRANSTPVDHVLFDDEAWTDPSLSSLKSLARDQLGTVGSGNHYIDLFKDEQGRTWVGVHFGSRGFGHKIATHFLREGGADNGMDSDPLVLSLSSPLGQDYLRAMDLALRYAQAGRNWVCRCVADLLGADIVEEIHNNHNYASRETHFGMDLWVVRKGATPSFPEQRGFIGGSMGDDAVIVEGVDSEESKLALYSTVHGAGRVMSRTVTAREEGPEDRRPADAGQDLGRDDAGVDRTKARHVARR